MPVVDGHEVIRRLRRHEDPALGQLPAVALTAYARSEDRIKAPDSGFQRHTARPIDPAELVAAVAALVRRPPAS